MISIEFSCPLPNGLHARPAWALKEQCSVWRSDIRFINNRLNTPGGCQKLAGADQHRHAV
ncbi:Phosphocarrier protein HPr/phosphoenolpyruvate--protein phosphotransferase [Enterobacter cancerogenus]|uniref:Phosphocarrier protein HPr/phosphoenolpyruvate--protein phosphotransferase n=1 Tax=Enterobacter cancerogenus TaxID=69218 RepID=A0A484X1C6_9ENTR|nr:Phosphocarrier protein HPr/phosphoenolpyruvate--protein phosphotransferase [Enterobacter cancerogenus]